MNKNEVDDLISMACKDIRRRMEHGEPIESLKNNEHFICGILRQVFQKGRENPVVTE